MSYIHIFRPYNIKLNNEGSEEKEFHGSTYVYEDKIVSTVKIGDICIRFRDIYSNTCFNKGVGTLLYKITKVNKSSVYYTLIDNENSEINPLRQIEFHKCKTLPIIVKVDTTNSTSESPLKTAINHSLLDKNLETCPVCLDNFTIKDMSITECYHHYCDACAMKLLKNKSESCALCRQVLRFVY
jgi:hypothetical protein